MNQFDEHRIELLWTVLLVGRLDLPALGLPRVYRWSFPRARLDRARTRALLPDAGMAGSIVALRAHGVLLCLN